MNQVKGFVKESTKFGSSWRMPVNGAVLGYWYEVAGCSTKENVNVGTVEEVVEELTVLDDVVWDTDVTVGAAVFELVVDSLLLLTLEDGTSDEDAVLDVEIELEDELLEVLLMTFDAGELIIGWLLLL
jgi:hypothetical protein